jgi:lysophospholipase L1-like esterase
MKIFILLVFISCLAFIAKAQPFIKEINAFKTQDSIQFPPKHAILFVGSSSFQHWHDVQDYFPKYQIINRGFGGSTLPDVIRYVNDIIFPYEPKQVVIYCGENDLASSDTVTAQIVFERFKTLFELIRNKWKNENVAFVSIKPAPSRERLMPIVEQTNELIKAFLEKQKNTSFVDVFHLMLTPEYKPLPEIFVSDSLHMNAKGYAIWQKAIEPFLERK